MIVEIFLETISMLAQFFEYVWTNFSAVIVIFLLLIPFYIIQKLVIWIPIDTFETTDITPTKITGKWECEYCRALNKQDLVKCNYCKAPRRK